MSGGAKGSGLRSDTVPRDFGRTRFVVKVQPLPPGTSAIPGLTRVATRKLNCTSGVLSARSTHQNAPPSKPFDVTGPVPNKANCSAAKAFQFSFLYLS